MTHEETTRKLREAEELIACLRLTNEGLAGMHERATSALEMQRDEAAKDLEELRHERAVAVAEVVSWTKRAHDLSSEAADLRVQLARAREEAGEFRSDLMETENRLDRMIDQRNEEVRTLEEKLHDVTMQRIGMGRAWREAVNEVASVLAQMSADRGPR